jgi:hypothetical protein
MRKYLFLVLVINLLLLKVFAEASTEDAIILNQELQYLEDSVKNIQSSSMHENENQNNNNVNNKPNLEKTYFADEMEEDTVSTKSSSQKRRGI